MEEYFCKVCGYINEYGMEPTFCVYCHSEASQLEKYADAEKMETAVRAAVKSYLESPDPITKPHDEADSSFRISLRQSLMSLNGKEVQRNDAALRTDERIEAQIDDAVKNYSLDPCPVGAVYEEINSALSRHYRRAIYSMSR